MADGQTMAAATEPESGAIATAVREHMRHQRWAQAAEALLSVPRKTVAEEFQLNICRNLFSFANCVLSNSVIIFFFCGQFA